MNIKSSFLLAALLGLCSACQSAPETQPVSAPQPQIVQPKPAIKHPLGIIGAVEPIYVLPIKSSFQARIDTGAKVSSLDVESYHLFERDGVKWVSFVVANNTSGERQTFEKPLKDYMIIRRIKKNEKRPIVTLNVKFGGKTIKADFTLAKRDKFDYQVLVGRNILTGRAIVDTSLSNTLR